MGETPSPFPFFFDTGQERTARGADILTLNRAYKAIASQAAKHGYRADLRQAAVARASAILRSQRPVKPEPPKKLRGAAARRAAAAGKQ